MSLRLALRAALVRSYSFPSYSSTTANAATAAIRRLSPTKMIPAASATTSPCWWNYHCHHRHQNRGNMPMMTMTFHTSAARAAIIEYKLADIGEGIVQCQLLQWYVQEGDTVHEFDRVCEVSSDKAVVDITSRFTGKITKLYYQVGDSAKVGSPLVQIDTGSSAEAPSVGKAATASSASAPSPSASAPPSPASAATPSASSHGAGSSQTLATPAVRHMAKQHNINLSLVRGTGKGGRITKEDILQFMEKPAAATAPSSAAETPVAKPMPMQPGKEHRETIKGFKKVMVRTMNEAWRRVPHFGLCDEVNMDELVALRAELKPFAASHNVKLTYMPFFIKAASMALNDFPILNSSVSEDETEIIFKSSHNIGIAMDTPNGLIVPNIKDCQNRSILEIAKELNRLQDLGAKGQLGPVDLTGGTFTFSNIGNMGGTYAKPIIVLPEVCIGAIGQTRKVAVFDDDDDEDTPRPVHMMNISWSADHRIIDGATMVRFSNHWKTFLQKPGLLLINLK